MSLIKGASGFQKLIVGYPTDTQLYDVASGVLESDSVENGDVLAFGSSHAMYKKATSVTSASVLAGVVLATNVKTPSSYPAEDNIPTKAGEALNVLVKGAVAVKLDSSAVLANATEGAVVYITSAGALTTVATSNIATSWKFTGVTETQGTAKVAEIRL